MPIVISTIFVRDTFLGASAGFVAYLAVNGGVFLLVTDSTANGIIANPFGSAFFAIVAGLFTEKGYRFLSEVIDQATAKATGKQDRSSLSDPPTE